MNSNPSFFDPKLIAEVTASLPEVQRSIRAYQRDTERRGEVFEQPSVFGMWDWEGHRHISMGNIHGLLSLCRLHTKCRVKVLNLVPNEVWAFHVQESKTMRKTLNKIVQLRRTLDHLIEDAKC